MQVLAYLGSPTQWFIFAIVVLVIFGSSRLPEVARNLGKSLGVLKKARREFEEELLNAQNPGPSTESEEQKAIAAAQKEDEKKDSPEA